AGRPRLHVEKYVEGRLVSILLVLAEHEGIDVAPLRGALDGHAFASFKDAPKLRSLISFLHTLIVEPSLSAAAKGRLLAQIAAPGTNKAVYARLNQASLVFALDRQNELEGPEVALADKVAELMAAFLGELGDADASKQFHLTFGKSRASRAIWTYVSKLETLGDSKVRASLTTFIQEVLAGNFSAQRQSMAENPHLKLLDSQRPGFLQAWFCAQPSRTAARSSSAADYEVWLGRSWLHEKLLQHGHLGDYLQGMSGLIAQFDTEKSAADREEARRRVAEQAQGKDAPALLQVEHVCLQLLNARKHDRKPLLQQLKAALLSLPRQTEFANDVAVLLAPRPVAMDAATAAHMQVVDSADPYDLLLCGTEVTGSCQRVDGSPALNKGLLGTLLNGQTRLIAVKHATSGKIVARSLLRALTDGSSPVLFLEPLYGDSSYRADVEAYAREKAEALGVPLTSARIGTHKHGAKLRSVGGRAPFEYCDGADGWNKLSPGSVYAIGKAWIVEA
ncbi:MAG: hypothetical protein INR71_09880, partial [Terriglobus roseus]|nr:hypothetical protein [Terriglobus roseus]